MRHLTGIILLISFFSWIVPLGAFIEASQEKQICNGRRAICLCTLYLQKMKRLQKVPVLEEQKDRDESEALQFPSFGSYFLNDLIFYSFNLYQQDYNFYETFHYASPLRRGMDPIPRVFV